MRTMMNLFGNIFRKDATKDATIDCENVVNSSEDTETQPSIFATRSTMFQCMVKIVDENSTSVFLGLRQMHARLAMDKHHVLELKAKSPGSLGKEMCVADAQWKIGSLALRLRLNDTMIVSVFVFECGKLKISGGGAMYHANTSPADICDKSYYEWMDTFVVKRVVELILIQPTNHRSTWELCLLNGSFSLGKQLVNPTNYRKVCERLIVEIVHKKHPFFVGAIMPICYDINAGHKRGRVCGTTLTFLSSTVGKKRINLRFDHGGRVQCLAAKSLEDIIRASKQLAILLESL